MTSNFGKFVIIGSSVSDLESPSTSRTSVLLISAGCWPIRLCLMLARIAGLDEPCFYIVFLDGQADTLVTCLVFPQDVQSKLTDVVLGKEKSVEESNPEYEKLKHYIFELENHLAEAEKHAYRLVKRHRGNKGFRALLPWNASSLELAFLLYSSYNGFHWIKICFKICSTELGQSLSDFGKAIKALGAHEGNSLGKALDDLGEKSETLSIRLQKEVSLNLRFIFT